MTEQPRPGRGECWYAVLRGRVRWAEERSPGAYLYPVEIELVSKDGLVVTGTARSSESGKPMTQRVDLPRSALVYRAGPELDPRSPVAVGQVWRKDPPPETGVAPSVRVVVDVTHVTAEGEDSLVSYQNPACPVNPVRVWTLPARQWRAWLKAGCEARRVA